MNEILIEIIKTMQLGPLIANAIVVWFFYDRLNKKLVDVDKRLQKLELDLMQVKTVLHMKECCMLQDQSQMKKAE